MPLLQPGQEIDRPEPASRFDRHHHARPYAALVVAGSCEEAGDRGRCRATAGDVLVHAAFDGHADAIGRQGAAFINFQLDEPLAGWFGRVDNVDEIVRANERDPSEAAALLCQHFTPVEQGSRDWPDLLAAELCSGTALHMGEWADARRLHPVSVSRGFRLAYGVSAKRFRLERMTSEAARRIASSGESLGAIAAACGFADQPHMNRSLRSMFGIRPRTLRTLS